MGSSSSSENGNNPSDNTNNMSNRACFSTTWTISWAEFAHLQGTKIIKYFSPSHENVVFRFRAELTTAMEGTSAGKFGFSVIYESGPLPALQDVAGTVDILKSDNSYHRIITLDSYDANRGLAINWTNFDDKDENTLKTKYGLVTSKALVYVISITIPNSAFNVPLVNSTFGLYPAWSWSLYCNLTDPENLEYWDVKFVSGDEKEFYCHRVFIGSQSKDLATMFRNPKSEKEQAGEFTFPQLDGDSLNAILKYLYTGECDVGQLPTSLIIQVADFGEQYDLKKMKGNCTDVLWQRVVEKPDDAIEIWRFADLHCELYLKERSLDVLTENFEKLSLQRDDNFIGNKDDSQAKRLQTEFNLHTLRRVSVVRNTSNTRKE